jgi:hypothetical protein
MRQTSPTGPPKQLRVQLASAIGATGEGVGFRQRLKHGASSVPPDALSADDPEKRRPPSRERRDRGKRRRDVGDRGREGGGGLCDAFRIEPIRRADGKRLRETVEPDDCIMPKKLALHSTPRGVFPMLPHSTKRVKCLLNHSSPLIYYALSSIGDTHLVHCGSQFGQSRKSRSSERNSDENGTVRTSARGTMTE